MIVGGKAEFFPAPDCPDPPSQSLAQSFHLLSSVKQSPNLKEEKNLYTRVWTWRDRQAINQESEPEGTEQIVSQESEPEGTEQIVSQEPEPEGTELKSLNLIERYRYKPKRVNLKERKKIS